MNGFQPARVSGDFNPQRGKRVRILNQMAKTFKLLDLAA
jgi:hypothetical protein